MLLNFPLPVQVISHKNLLWNRSYDLISWPLGSMTLFEFQSQKEQCVYLNYMCWADTETKLSQASDQHTTTPAAQGESGRRGSWPMKFLGIPSTWLIVPTGERSWPPAEWKLVKCCFARPLTSSTNKKGLCSSWRGICLDSNGLIMKTYLVDPFQRGTSAPRVTSLWPSWLGIVRKSTLTRSH